MSDDPYVRAYEGSFCCETCGSVNGCKCPLQEKPYLRADANAVAVYVLALEVAVWWAAQRRAHAPLANRLGPGIRNTLEQLERLTRDDPRRKTVG